jgi:hypothetical protein
MKRLLFLILLVALTGCAVRYSQCVDMVYLQYDEKNIFKDRYFFKCDLYPWGRPHVDGWAADCVQVAVPRFCPYPAQVGTGHYTVHIPRYFETSSSYILRGVGAGNKITVTPNRILDSDLKKKKEVKDEKK